MHLRTGVDLIEIDRVRQAVERHGERFVARVYTAEEVRCCGGRIESLAARFAAKEAVAKARGTGLTDPRKLTCTAVDGDRLTIDGVVVTTRADDDAHIVAWTWLEPA